MLVFVICVGILPVSSFWSSILFGYFFPKNKKERKKSKSKKEILQGRKLSHVSYLTWNSRRKEILG